MEATSNHPQSIESKLVARIRRRGRGCVLVPSDFLDLGSRQATDVALHRLAMKGTIRRLALGLYDYPKEHPLLGMLAPTADTVARALAGRDRTRIQPTGAYAANLLGLSDQVPARLEFMTDGPSRTVRVGEMTIQLKRTTPKNLAASGKLSGLVIQALKSLGQKYVAPDRIEHLRITIPGQKRRELLKDLPLAPAWMHAILRRIAEDP